MPAERVSDIRDQCQEAGVTFHFKQSGGIFKKRNGLCLEGHTWEEMPALHTEILTSTPVNENAYSLLRQRHLS